MKFEKKVYLLALMGFSLFLSAFIFFMLDYIYAGKSLSFTTTWLKAEDSNIRVGNLLNSVSKYQKIMFASDFLQGVSIFDKGLTPLVEFGDPIAKPEKFTAGMEEISIKRGGVFRYYTYYHFPKNENIFIVFHFYDWAASLVYLIIIIVILLTFLVVLTFIVIEHKNHYDTISKTILLTIQQVSHDFRAPFAIIKKVFSHIKNDANIEFTSKLKEYESQIASSFGIVNGLIEDMLTSNKKENLHFSRIDVEALIRDVLHTHFDSVPHVSFKVSCKGNRPFAGDYNKILRIIYNLLNNAVSHCEKLVWIEVVYGENTLKISIINDGVPIEKDQVSNIFQPFQSFRSGGIGLGLFICKQLVEAHGGQIWCEPVSVGTQFHITLDYAELPDENSGESTTDGVAGNTEVSEAKQEDLTRDEKVEFNRQIKIVAIDDQKFYLENLRSNLEHPEIEMSVFQHTDDFLMSLRSSAASPDLIIVDRFGPGFDVQENKFADSCRDFGYCGPIVLYSNSVSDSTLAETEGFFRVMPKDQDFTVGLVAEILSEFHGQS